MPKARPQAGVVDIMSQRATRCRFPALLLVLAAAQVQAASAAGMQQPQKALLHRRRAARGHRQAGWLPSALPSTPA